MNLDRNIYEGWTPRLFIEELEVTFPYVKETLKTDKELKRWCKSEQPYYKKHIPEVYNHFLKQVDL